MRPAASHDIGRDPRREQCGARRRLDSVTDRSGTSPTRPSGASSERARRQLVFKRRAPVSERADPRSPVLSLAVPGVHLPVGVPDDGRRHFRRHRFSPGAAEAYANSSGRSTSPGRLIPYPSEASSSFVSRGREPADDAAKAIRSGAALAAVGLLHARSVAVAGRLRLPASGAAGRDRGALIQTACWTVGVTGVTAAANGAAALTLLAMVMALFRVVDARPAPSGARRRPEQEANACSMRTSGSKPRWIAIGARVKRPRRRAI